MPYQPEYRYIPPANLHVLTRWYDALCLYVGIGGRLKQKVLRTLPPRAGDTVLDVGCGTGILLELAVRQYPDAHYLGVDPDEPALSIARERLAKFGSAVELQQGFGESLPVHAASVDICYSTLVLHHMPDPIKERAVQEMHRVLKNSGKLLIADFGRTDNWLLRRIFFFEKFEYIKGNFDGLIPHLVHTAGFTNVRTLSREALGVELLYAEK